MHLHYRNGSVLVVPIYLPNSLAFFLSAFSEYHIPLSPITEKTKNGCCYPSRNHSVGQAGGCEK